MFKDLETLREQIQVFGLDRLEEKIVSLAKPAIQMRLEAADEQNLAAGASKLGGWPDLPSDFQWPYYETKPLTFMGQFKLSELARHDMLGILPTHGILYYFGAADEVLWGEDQALWKMAYLADEQTPLIRTPHPSYQTEDCMIDALPIHRIEYTLRYSLPIIFWHEQADFDINFLYPPGDETDPACQVDHDAYFRLLDAAYPEPYHHWLGHPLRKQGYIEREVVIAREKLRPQKISVFDYRYSEEQVAHIQSEMVQWQFLFQISSDDRLGIGWGDDGTLYICIPKTSLATLRFEDCWTVMQCY